MGVERYGFHGLSLESILAQLETIPERVVVGAPRKWIEHYRHSPGQIDRHDHGFDADWRRNDGYTAIWIPGVMLFLMRKGYADPAKLEDLVDHRSGLAGVSGISSDVRELKSADLALRMFSYQVGKAIAAMAAALGGMDLLIVTGGIGEHAEGLRNEICAPRKFIDAFEIRVLPAQEDLQIARIAQRLTSGRDGA
jgi:acetate kinase